MNKANTVEEYAENAVKRYIQTAVYIDDKLFSDSAIGDQTDVAKTIQHRGRLSKDKSAKSTELNSAPGLYSPSQTKKIKTSDDPITMHAKDIIKGFASKQIICSLYQTQPIDGNVNLEREDIINICSSADIIILDWKLKNMETRSGTATKSIIEQIVKQSIDAVPEQLRLIVVYTIESDLKKIILDIYKKLIKIFKVNDNTKIKDVQKNLSFDIHNCKISLFKKPNGFEDRHSKNFVVGYENLAEKAVKEYTKMVPGILQATTLNGLATIRNNYKKIITKFDKDMDRGFLTHLGMTLPTGNALSQIIPLLTSEFESVLEDSFPNPIIPDEVIADWIDNQWNPKAYITKPMNRNRDEILKIGKDVLKIGFKDAGKMNSVKLQPEMMFMENKTSKDNEIFARLLSSRTFYSLPPKLTLGTIVWDESNSQFLLCIQPVCDSVRLKEFRKAVKFLFLKLHKRDPNKTSKAHAVFTLHDYRVELDYKSKASDCLSIGFRSGHHETIIAKKDRQNKFYFRNNVGDRYTWVDQLRSEHAQRAAEIFGREISRVGLTESEWLRLKAEGKIK